MGTRAGSTIPQIHLEMIVLLLLLPLLCSVSSFTPPRIIYGGWTPILPGHPFYFGSIKKHNDYHQYTGQYGHQDSTHSPSLHHSHGHSYPDASYQDHTSQGHSYPDPSYQDHTSHDHGEEDEYRNYRYGKGNLRHTGSYDGPKNGIGHINTKSIFAYYPQQSAYDQHPRYAKPQSKPVYNEMPRKPFDILEKLNNFGTYTQPSGRDLQPQDLKVLNHGGKEAYLQVTPIGKVHPNSIKPIGQIHLGNIHQYPSTNSLNYKPNYGSTQSLRNYEAALYNSRPHASNFNSISHNNLHGSAGPHSNRENTFKGTSFPHSGKDVIRNFKDAKREHSFKYSIDPNFELSKDVYYIEEDNYKNPAISPNPSILPSSQLYSPQTGPYSSSHKAPYTPAGVSKDLYSSSSLDKINKVIRSFGPKSKLYSGSKSKHTTPFLAPGSYNFEQYPKSIQSIIQSNQRPSPNASPEKPQVNKNYDYKNVGVGNFYHDPSTLSNIDDIPTIIDKDVEIVHLPPHQYSSNTDQDVLYIKGTSPTKHSPTDFRSSNAGNGTFHHYSYEPETYVERPIEFHLIDDPPGSDSEVAGSHRNPSEEQESVFVGTRTLDSSEIKSVTAHSQESDDEKKQFFHAYYAPSNHSPPEGYMKMTIDEFQKLFKDAEIQYVQRSEGDGISRSHQVAEKRNSS